MFIGLLMFGVYSSIMIIVLLNMLIAMMSNSYQYIAVNRSDRLKFSLARWSFLEFNGNRMEIRSVKQFEWVNSKHFVSSRFRAKLWISYFEDGGTLPPPFNIIPSPKSIWYGCMFVYRRVFGCSKKHLRNRWQSIKVSSISSSLSSNQWEHFFLLSSRLQKIISKIHEREIKYQAVIRELVKRYIMKRQQREQTEGVTEDDLNEIKQDVSAFR